MSTITGSFTVHPPARFVVSVGGKTWNFSSPDRSGNEDPVLKAVLDEYDSNGTTSGTVTITAT
jgi:hypothetical protein